MTNAFGGRLYETFFRSYTEKVWGIPCSEISADWAAQRIKDLSMLALIKRALRFGPKNGGPVIKTLIDRFRYPRTGRARCGRRCAKTIEARGAAVQMGESVVSIRRGRRRSGLGHDRRREAAARLYRKPLHLDDADPRS